MKAKRERKLTVNEKRILAERLVKSAERHKAYEPSEYEKYRLRLAVGGNRNDNVDMWFLCNDVLNTVRQAIGKPLRPWQENPHLGGNRWTRNLK